MTVRTGAGWETSASSTTLAGTVVTLPANLAVGQLLVCLATDKNGTGTVSFSAGTWTSQQVVQTGRRGSISWIVIDPTSLAALGTPGSSTLTVTQGSGTSRRVVELIILTGRDLGSPFDAVSAEYQQGVASATWTATGLTATRPGSDIVALGYNNAASNVQYSMAPTDGLTQASNPYVFDGASATTLNVLYQNAIPAGATGTRTATISPTPTIVSGGFMVAFAARPPAPIITSQAVRRASNW